MRLHVSSCVIPVDWPSGSTIRSPQYEAVVVLVVAGLAASVDMAAVVRNCLPRRVWMEADPVLPTSSIRCVVGTLDIFFLVPALLAQTVVVIAGHKWASHGSISAGVVVAFLEVTESTFNELIFYLGRGAVGRVSKARK